MDNKPIVPGSAARAAEKSEPAPNQKIEPGSAARISEQSDSSSVPRGAFRATMSITPRASNGVKFEVFDQPHGPGEALPQGYAPPAATSAKSVATGSPDSSGGDSGQTASESPPAGLFRRLFGR